jgi:hypothetical protein
MTSPKTSATGGFILPSPQPPELDTTPPGLNFVQFVQQLLVGLSELPGNLVRPEWQIEPPKQPDLAVNWLAFGLGSAEADFNAFVTTGADGVSSLQRNELIPIRVSVYGPDAYDIVALVRDGFQLTQNLASLRQANVGYAYESPAVHMPDLYNERWYNRWIIEIFVRRQILRTYPILSFISAHGTIYTQTAVNQNYEQPWAVEE